MTLYRIGDIRPNPFRNIDRYPINRDKVEKLKDSIGRTDFWDNLVARERPFDPTSSSDRYWADVTDEDALGGRGPEVVVEIGYGHHRMVALRELYDDDHEINLIIRDLDDAAMLHVMADENMDEWASSGAVIIETVRAVREFLLLRAQEVTKETASTTAITKFLGWPESRVEKALIVINAEEAGHVRTEDTAELDLEQAVVLQRAVRKIVEPAIRARAIKAVRASVLHPDKTKRAGSRDIGSIVREVRAAASPPVDKPIVASQVAEGIYSEIDKFWRVAVDLNGHGRLTRAEVIRLIAANRDSIELTKTTYGLPWAEQIALALDEMARTATALSAALRADDAVGVVA